MAVIMTKNTLIMIEAALCLSLSLLLPFLTGQIPQIGNLLLPMHFPILLCGLICGWKYGLTIGFVAPLLRFILFGMPPLFPVGIAMAFELATYGFVVGILYHSFKRNLKGLYFSLIITMISGRIVWGLVMTIISGVTSISFSLQAFISVAFILALPGLIFQIIVIPPIVIALKKSKIGTFQLN